ncbi:uncharacterized protein LOC108846666 isoform X2 [Raphanus sativus]|uniref:Uncharacterized protein LOC108846666 isoform X2 n=1 Tax=Raphanus sativus TaxID=3726 RepID=A0A9W3DB20_RAPSA|nr:uncharacterized protein LOC130507130 isoform X2 [Raphanus sativus]XP_056861050.1 uncharacterized protein LOC130509281 isoform X2 [Raphanus sativus]XP_056863111.1 uncharacterized protein LOC108846666 isoform X2 [Raphanus sativus]
MQPFHLSKSVCFIILLKMQGYYVVGNMKLVNGQSHIERRILDEEEIATTPRVMVHLQSQEFGPVMKLYFWEKTATDFCKKFTAYKNTPTLLLVTKVNTKHLGDEGNNSTCHSDDQRKQSVLNMEMRAFTTHLRDFTPSFAVSVFLFQFEHWLRLSP